LWSSSLGHSSSGRHSRSQGGNKNKGTIHAVCGTPSGILKKSSGLRRTIACLPSHSLRPLDQRALITRVRKLFASVFQISGQENQLDREGCRNTSDYRAVLWMGQLWVSRLSTMSRAWVRPSVSQNMERRCGRLLFLDDSSAPLISKSSRG